jgi:hypothetical protein
MVGQSYSAGIDDENMAHIISLFTDLYSDREMAVIREYSTNALDAQIEDGYTGPIEVTLPTPLTPFFKVTDHGCGLSHDDIRTIYSRYGTSTKRATNDQNGMLGLGCKSALTYCQQFTVESVKDGVRMVCSISRDGMSVPVMTVVDTRATDEPNGTTVTVPVRRDNDFASKAQRFYAHWKPGTVLVNGEQPVPLEGLRIADDLLVVQQGVSWGRVQDYVVMGNVAYPHDFGGQHGLPYGHSLVVEVPIGSVEFAPSREALSYSRKTNETLKDIPGRVKEALLRAVQEAVAKCETTQAAVKTLLTWRQLVGNTSGHQWHFKGRAIPETLEGYSVLTARSGKLSHAEKAPRGISMDYVPDALIVVGYDVENFTAVHKRKLLQFCADRSITPERFILRPDAPDMTWVRPDQIAKWEDVKAIKLPTNSTGRTSGRPTGSYDAYFDGNRYAQHIQAEDIDTDEPLFYCRSLNAGQSYEFADILRSQYPSATVVCVPENRFAKFQRNFPSAKSHNVGITDAYAKWESGITKAQRIALAIQAAGEVTTLGYLDVARIDDPKVKAAIQASKTDVTAVLQQRKVFQRVLHMIRPGETEAWENPLEKYPLLDDISLWRDGRMEHVYIYMNAVYALDGAA